jgi:hypothetical protein
LHAFEGGIDHNSAIHDKEYPARSSPVYRHRKHRDIDARSLAACGGKVKHVWPPTFAHTLR